MEKLAIKYKLVEDVYTAEGRLLAGDIVTEMVNGNYRSDNDPTIWVTPHTIHAFSHMFKPFEHDINVWVNHSETHFYNPMKRVNSDWSKKEEE